MARELLLALLQESVVGHGLAKLQLRKANEDEEAIQEVHRLEGRDAEDDRREEHGEVVAEEGHNLQALSVELGEGGRPIPALHLVFEKVSVEDAAFEHKGRVVEGQRRAEATADVGMHQHAVGGGLLLAQDLHHADAHESQANLGDRPEDKEGAVSEGEHGEAHDAAAARAVGVDGAAPDREAVAVADHHADLAEDDEDGHHRGGDGADLHQPRAEQSDPALLLRRARLSVEEERRPVNHVVLLALDDVLQAIGLHGKLLPAARAGQQEALVPLHALPKARKLGRGDVAVPVPHDAANLAAPVAFRAFGNDGLAFSDQARVARPAHFLHGGEDVGNGLRGVEAGILHNLGLRGERHLHLVQLLVVQSGHEKGLGELDHRVAQEDDDGDEANGVGDGDDDGGQDSDGIVAIHVAARRHGDQDDQAKDAHGPGEAEPHEERIHQLVLYGEVARVQVVLLKDDDDGVQHEAKPKKHLVDALHILHVLLISFNVLLAPAGDGQGQIQR
mmetsp:Transcript_16430/g.62418  ORF Transcript_16430/g.62418 Transcript_16430/m.62418 type:complete len:504 (-) Transcript_16430:29-1540(-)